MRLKRLDLFGFKTFATRTEIELHSGITAIVGPNGSGKSNISDALRWVLGEQTARQIRTRRSEDVIFAGGVGRPPAGLAEVTLAIETFGPGLLEAALRLGHGHDLPVANDWAPDRDAANRNGSTRREPADLDDLAGEIALTRRIHRSAEMEYLLNGRRVRLRDVGDLLARTRIAQNPYAIISQGMVDATLDLRPEERRGLLEEAADVRRHQQRMAEAQERLAATAGNLCRINDLLAELGPRLPELQRAAEEAEGYFRIQRQVIAWLKAWYAMQRVALQERLRRAEVSLTETRAEAHGWVVQRDAIAADLEQLLERRRKLRASHEAATTRLGELERLSADAARRCAIANERVRLEQGRRGELGRELTAAEDELATVERTVVSIQQQTRRLAVSGEESEQFARRLAESVGQLEQERRGVQARIDARAAAARRSQLAMADVRGRLAQVDQRLGELTAAERPRAAEQASTIAALEERRHSLEAAQVESDRAVEAHRQAVDEYQRLQEQFESLQSAAAELRSRISDQEAEARTLAQRIDLLAGLSDQPGVVPSGVQAVLRAARTADKAAPHPASLRSAGLSQCPPGGERHHDLPLPAQGAPGEGRGEGPAPGAPDPGPRTQHSALSTHDSGLGTRLTGIRGTVGELIHVPKEYEVAIEVALGGRLHDIVVERWVDAEAAIEFLKRTQRGRATFLPLDTLRASGRGATPQGRGVRGLAADLVESDPEHSVVVEHLLGRTIVVEDLAVARRLLDSGLRGEQVVTLAGEIVRSSGAVTGGSVRQPKEGGVLTRERELRAALARLTDAERRLAGMRTEHERLIHSLDRQRTALPTAGAEVKRLQAIAEQAVRRVEAARRDLERLDQQRAWAVEIERRAQQEVAGLERRRSELVEELERHAGEPGLAAGQEDFDRDELGSIDRRLSRLRDELSQRRADAGALRASLQAEEAALGREQERQRRLTSQLHARRSQVAETERTMGALAGEVAQLTETIAAYDGDRAQARAELEPMVVELAWLDLQEQSVRARKAAADEQLTQSERAVFRAETEAEQLRTQLQHLEERMVGELDADELADAVPGDASPPPADVEPEAFRRRIDRLRSQLRRIGPVNPRAVEEYETAAARHRFLSEQASDLRATEANLRDTIRELEARVRSGFANAFHALNREFGTAFSTLFGGGQARLVLTEERDLATSGVDIVAQPPGKRLMPLSALSGGERALTGIALVFGLLGANPTPFCILDEVDAALDEANVVRFARVVQSMAKQTQFVLITHNRATIETSDAIYGVTLGGDGVSRLLSLRLDRALELA